jgi:hypothetical protein
MKIINFLLLTLGTFYLTACSGSEVKWYTAYYYYPYRGDTLKPSFDDGIIRIDQKGDSIKGLFYSNSDEFETGRAGYLPGFAVLEMLGLKIKDSTITFYADPRGVTFLSRPFPLDYKSNAEAMAADTAKYKRWSFNSITDSYDTVHYSGQFYGDSIKLKGKYYGDSSHTFAKISEQEVRSRIGKIDYRFVSENTYGEEAWRKKGLDPAELDMATYLSDVLFEIDMTYYYYQANGEGGEPSYGDCLLRLKKRADGTYKGWYYGNTDDCTAPRTEGYPGFFAKAMENLTVRDGKISFTVTFADTYFLNRPSHVENRTNIYSLDNSMGDAPCRVWIKQEETPLVRDSAVYTGTFGEDGITLDSTAATRACKHFVKITKDEAIARMNSIDTAFVSSNTSQKEYTYKQLRTKQMIKETDYAQNNIE